MPMCSSSMVAIHISSTIMHSWMFMHVSITFILMLNLGISLSLPILWVNLDSHSAIDSYGPGLQDSYVISVDV